MRGILLVTFLSFSLFLSAQDSAQIRVNENNKKIDELTIRANSLLSNDSLLVKDSVSNSNAVNELNRKISLLKNENKSLSDSIKLVEGIKSNKAVKSLAITSLENESKNGSYFVVVSSVRTAEGAKEEMKKLSNRFQGLKVVQNKRKSWYHLIINNPTTIHKASIKVKAIRNSIVKDAWFINKDALSD